MSFAAEMKDELRPLQLYASYPFSSDEEYQNGLQSIIAGGALANDPSEDIKEEIFRRTRVFYFNRVTGHAITMEEAREFEHTQKEAGVDASSSSVSTDSSHSSPSDSDSAPAVLSFAQLQALIEAGKEDQIPNNKLIPDVLNEDVPSASAAPVRKKPWEIYTEDAQAP